MNEELWWADCKNRGWCKHNQPAVDAIEVKHREANAAAVRVRARRRICRTLGISIGVYPLAPLLKVAIAVEKLGGIR